jgi:uncharacterized membrane protein YtjA (UPF0391 family)
MTDPPGHDGVVAASTVAYAIFQVMLFFFLMSLLTGRTPWS